MRINPEIALARLTEALAAAVARIETLEDLVETLRVASHDAANDAVTAGIADELRRKPGRPRKDA